jgi:hypothetical protein
MKITRADAEHLVFVDFPLWIGLIFFPLSAFYLLRLCLALAAHPRKTSEWLIGLVGFSMCFAGAALFTRRSVFDFDLAARQLRWHRRGLLSRRCGCVPLADIRSVNLECCRATNSRGGGRRIYYRIALHTVDGVLPLTQAYALSRDHRHEQMREQIARALALSVPTVADDVAELLKSDRKADAALMISVHESLDMAVAEKRVEAMGAGYSYPPR